eukprot:6350284-Prymnesium_polylepis.1
MEMNIHASFGGPAMIFGLPFLRRYAARFDRNNQTVALGEIPLGSSLCTHCGDSHESEAASALLSGQAEQLSSPAAHARPSKFNDAARSDVSPGALLPPSGAGLVRERPLLRPAHVRMPSWMSL